MALSTAPTGIHDQGHCQTKQHVSGEGDPNQHLVGCLLNLFVCFMLYKRGNASCAATVHDALGVRKAARQQAGHKTMHVDRHTASTHPPMAFNQAALVVLASCPLGLLTGSLATPS